MIRIFLSILLLLPTGSAADGAQALAGGSTAPPPILRVVGERPLPPMTGPVLDQADLLSREAEEKLTGRLKSLEAATTDQLIVVTVPSLQGQRIEDLGLRLGNGWAIGRKGVDNGVLLIVVPGDRQARIEVGTGLEGLLTDKRAQRITDEQVVPACRKGRCDLAIAAGVDAIAAVLRSDSKRPRRKRGDA